MTGKAPAYQHYAKEWLVDTAYLTLQEQGAYQRLLDHQWVNGALPPSPRDRAALLGVTPVTFRRIWARIRGFFPDGLNPRLEEIRRAQQAYRASLSESGRRGAQRRWHGEACGDPNSHPNGQAIGHPYGESMRLQSAAATATEDKSTTEAAAALRARLPSRYHEALDGYLRAAKTPETRIATILTECADAASCENVGRALLEMSAAGKPFTPVLLRAFVRRLRKVGTSVAAAPRSQGYEGTMFRQAK